MKQTAHSEKYKRHRKFLMVAPLLTLPFIATIFYVLGGGHGADASATPLDKTYGLNMQLPDAQLKDEKSLNKMSFYDQAASDSIKHAALLKDDPYSSFGSVNNVTYPREGSDSEISFARKISRSSDYMNKAKGPVNEYQDPNEEKVYKKLAALNKAMDQASAPNEQPAAVISGSNYQSTPATDLNRLERIVRSGKSGDGEDPEVTQLNSMLDKIMEIQHPERSFDQVKRYSKERETQVFPVFVDRKKTDISFFERTGKEKTKDTIISGNASGFFSVAENKNEDLTQNSIEAVIPEGTSLVSGSTVKMMLSNNVFIGGELIPKGTYLYGTASINDERLTINIQSIRYQNSLFAVKLSVFDLDGMEGVFIPGAISRDVAKSSVEQAVQGINIPSIDPSISAQAATAGVQAAKSLLTRKAKLVKVHVTQGYKILLKQSSL